MTKTIKLLTLFASVVALTTACTDDLFDTVSSSGTDSGGLQFEMSTVEMGHEVVSMGSTRSGSVADAGTPSESDRFKEHALEGDNTFGLKAVRQPVPLMGFNHGAVKAGSSSVGAGSPSVGESAILSQTQQPQSQTQQPQSQTQQQQSQTRAGANEVVKVDMTNFHDSLTIWGYTDNGTELFDQILLTKVRNWRNSVEWPYDQGDYMKFYAVAPSLESINMSATGGNFSEAPTFTYTLPEKSNELLDVLYGESENISIAAGPAGATGTNPKDENMGKDNKHISLQFRHITTAVRFSQGNIPEDVTIKSISISGSKTEGTYSPANLDDDTGTLGEWSTGAATQTYELTDAAVFNTTLFLLPQTLPTGAELRVKLTDSESKEHTLKCSLVDDVWKKGFTIDYKITIGRIEAGYYLSTTESTVELEHSSSAVSSTLGVNSYRLYYDYSSGTQVPSYTAVTWDVAGYSETEEGSFSSKTANLSWLTDFRGVLNVEDNHYNGGNNATASFTVAGQTKALSATHDEVLSGNNTSASGLDLSTNDPYIGGGSHDQETANCYIVNRVGSYTFPLVYGNKTSNGAEAACFKDHKGATIAYRLIQDQMAAKDITEVTEAGASRKLTRYTWDASKESSRQTLNAVLLWQDVRGFISAVGCTTTNISFTVGTSVPANAVIALQGRTETEYQKSTDSGVTWTLDTSKGTDGYEYGEWETLWTWHIWMTDEVYRNNGVSNGQSYDTYYINGTSSGSDDHIAEVQDYKTPSTTYKILPVNLGWVPADDNFGLYKERSVWVQLNQTGTTNTCVVKITQHARQDLYTGTGTVYQWGRPTAFPALRDLGGNVRNVYDIDNNAVTSRFVLAQAVSGTGYGGDAISNPFGVLQWEDNPNAWFNVSKNRFDETDDYVTARAMWNSDTKTVYDPCPPGFRVPPAKVFYTFSKTGTTVQSGAGQLNMWPETQDLNGVTQRNGLSSNGGYFYCKPNETDRYGAMVYMPTTGEWQGNKSVGTQLSEGTEQINQTSTGIYWTSDYFNPYNSGTINSQGCALWITPSYTFSAGTADKPVIGFFDEADHKSNYYGHLRAIRPMKK